jgi:hypothetical protein
MVEGLLRREVVGQKLSGTTAFGDVEDSVDDFTEVLDAGSPIVLWSRQVSYGGTTIGHRRVSVEYGSLMRTRVQI